MCSPLTPTGSGARSCAVRTATSLSSPPIPTTQRSISPRERLRTPMFGPAGHRRPGRDGKLENVSTEVMPDSDLKVHEDLKVDTSHGDHERFAHYVDKNDMMQAAVFGTPIKALCGKVWVPSRDPQKFPVCPECKEIYESLPPGDDNDE